jgi:hypothetical protein
VPVERQVARPRGVGLQLVVAPALAAPVGSPPQRTGRPTGGPVEVVVEQLAPDHVGRLVVDLDRTDHRRTNASYDVEVEHPVGNRDGEHDVPRTIGTGGVRDIDRSRGRMPFGGDVPHASAGMRPAQLSRVEVDEVHARRVHGDAVAGHALAGELVKEWVGGPADLGDRLHQPPANGVGSVRAPQVRRRVLHRHLGGDESDRLIRTHRRDRRLRPRDRQRGQGRGEGDGGRCRHRGSCVQPEPDAHGWASPRAQAGRVRVLHHCAGPHRPALCPLPRTRSDGQQHEREQRPDR